MTEVELDFMAHLLSMDPGQRMTGEECLQHPYLLDLTLSDQVGPIFITAADST
jgi:hypothetical protein